LRWYKQAANRMFYICLQSSKKDPLNILELPNIIAQENGK